LEAFNLLECRAQSYMAGVLSRSPGDLRAARTGAGRIFAAKLDGYLPFTLDSEGAFRATWVPRFEAIHFSPRRCRSVRFQRREQRIVDRSDLQ
jgi:hypothetical protein